MAWRGTLVLSSGFSVLLLLAAGTARAASLEYTAPESCPARESVIEDIERLLGGKLANAPGTDVVLTVVERPDGRYRATVRTVPREQKDGSRIRELDGDSCTQAADAAVVAIALALRGEQSAESSASSPPEPERPVPPAAPKASPPTSARPAPQESSPRLEIGMGLIGVLDVGALPSLAPGGEIEVFLGVGAARFVVFGTAFATQEVRFSDGSGGRFELVLGGGAACLVRPLEPFRIAGCTGFEAGTMSAEGFGVPSPSRESVTWLAPRVEVRGEIVLVGELRGVAGLGATFPLTRHNFVLNDSRSVHRASVITGRLAAGLSFSF